MQDNTRWQDILPEDAMQHGDALAQKAEKEIQTGKTIFPAPEKIFKALELTPPSSVHAVIIGQDPYINPGQAHGLAFSVENQNCIIPPSVINIHKELFLERGEEYRPGVLSCDLTPWAKNGVLLLNASLTVEAGKSNSHADWGWNTFTGAVIRQCLLLPQPIVFLLWGAFARNLLEQNSNVGTVKKKWKVTASHPSPLSAMKTYGNIPAFIGSYTFSAANNALGAAGAEPIAWFDLIRTGN